MSRMYFPLNLSQISVIFFVSLQVFLIFLYLPLFPLYHMHTPVICFLFVSFILLHHSSYYVALDKSRMYDLISTSSVLRSASSILGSESSVLRDYFF